MKEWLHETPKQPTEAQEIMKLCDQSKEKREASHKSSEPNHWLQQRHASNVKQAEVAVVQEKQMEVKIVHKRGREREERKQQKQKKHRQNYHSRSDDRKRDVRRSRREVEEVENIEAEEETDLTIIEEDIIEKEKK
ncbi:putative uncharacterized protein DDB_G0271982 [Centruroides vittatus]|uniref:putative uncharacterized protein DDB_G0271982 n=1 Tax=Centruroides vittatus TaxID=120091 RepID=UPI00350EC27F